MTPEEEAVWKEKCREKSLRYYYKNADVINKKARDKYVSDIENQREKKRERARQDRLREPEKYRIRSLDRSRKLREENPEKFRMEARQRSRRAYEDMAVAPMAFSLGISAKLLRQHPDLLEAKREHLKALRQLKTQTKNQNAPEPE